MPKVNKEVTREQYPILYNETPSLTDSVYRDENDPFRDLSDKSPLDAKTNKVMTRAMAAKANTVQLLPLPSTAEIIEKYQPSISEHISRRINSLFLQLICCYKTQLHFEIGDTLAQGASVRRLELGGLDDKGNATTRIIQRNATHSSTIPCLAVKSGDSKKFFLVGTDAFRIWNATMNMPAWINKVDTKIDGDSKGSKLRTKTLDLINNVAQKNIDPVQGLIKFVHFALMEVERAYKIETDSCYRDILSLYKTELTKILEEKCDMSVRIESLLETTVFDPSLREAIYEIRYDAIRNAQFYQEQLLQKITEIKETLLTELLITAKKKPDHFEAAFRTLLIESVPTDDQVDQNRSRIEKLYNFSPFDFESRLISGNLTKYKKTKQLIAEKYQKIIHALSNDLCDAMKKFREKEKEKIGTTITFLREAKGWKKEELAEKITISLKKLSQLEDKGELVTEEIIEKISRVIEVSPNLFVPEFFYQ